MKLDLSKVEYSKNDIKRQVTIPSYLTKELAYFIGIHVGDGYLRCYKRKICKRVDYNIECCGHEIDEIEFHKEYIVPLIKKLFNIDAFVRFGNRSTVQTYFRSKAVFCFLNRVINLPNGSKRNINVPEKIKLSSMKIKKYFLMGFFDTEGCMTFKRRYRQKHYYPCIAVASQSKNLIKTVKTFLDDCKIKACVSYDTESSRNGKVFIRHEIDIYGENYVEMWFNEIGFNSSKHLTKYDIWKRFGFCPPYTNILERQKILDETIDVNSYY